MTFSLLIFAFVIASLFALLEIQIEGKDGWAGKLPTWRLKNPFKKFINWPYITGYHTYFHMLFLSIFQLPFLLGWPFSFKNELLIFELYFIIVALEDFLWFVFNPRWGIRKFFTQEIPWHSKKVFFFPRNYWIAITVLLVLELLRSQI